MDRIKQRLAFLINRANKLKGTNLPVPKLKTFIHSIAAGAAEKFNDKYTIYINKELYENGMSFILDEILPHEVAHIILFKKNQANHNKEWQNLCKALGGTGNALVRSPIQIFGRAIHYQYRICGKPTVWVNRQQHKALQASKKQWSFSNIEPFVFVGSHHYTGKTVKGNPYG